MYKNQWGFLVDVNYLDLESDMTLATERYISQNVDLNLTVAEFSGLYRLSPGIDYLHYIN